MAQAHASSLATWAFPGYGHAEQIEVPKEELERIRHKMQKPRHLLGEWPSTGISGNDLLSSCLYSSGIVASKAGKLAPIPTLMVACLMYLFRFVYVEVVSAIPLNGGSYNTMLNTSSKRVAAMTAALAIIAYLATGVVGAVSASDYLKAQATDLNSIQSAIGILFTFALLNFLGMAESSVCVRRYYMHGNQGLIGHCTPHLWAAHPHAVHFDRRVCHLQHPLPRGRLSHRAWKGRIRPN